MKNFGFGIDNLLQDPALKAKLGGRRVGLVAHPASVTSQSEHSLDALINAGIRVERAFGPQHGLRGDRQDNMMESGDFTDPRHRIPVISLYGTYRYPQPEMLTGLDVVLFDLQDIGCRVYTYITTLRHFVKACMEHGVELWILDRPNPSGRPVDGMYLVDGEQSFVGCDLLPMRHGLTIGELAVWFADQLTCSHPKIIPMMHYEPSSSPGFGWPLSQIPWINPSPNASSLNMARCFPGTVLLEGTTLSEGRGTTTPLEVTGAPDIPVDELISLMEPQSGIRLRPCCFTPVFHKHVGALCQGFQIHTDSPDYLHEAFKPFRLMAGFLKALRQLRPEYDLWRYHEYEYETDRIPVDVINGGPILRQWVDDAAAGAEELDTRLEQTELDWLDQRHPYLHY